MTDELRKAARELVTHEKNVRLRAAKGRTVAEKQNDAMDRQALIESLRAALSAPTPEPPEAVTQEQVEAWMIEAGWEKWQFQPDALQPDKQSMIDHARACRHRFATLAYAAGRAAAGKDAEDARRYRWLREQPSETWKYIGWNTWNDHPLVFPYRDAAIDRAMSEKESAK